MKVKHIKSLTLATVCVALAGVASFNAFARPAYGTETTYYSDAARTDVVGTKDFTCTGRTFTWGSATQYYDVITYKCN